MPDNLRTRIAQSIHDNICDCVEITAHEHIKWDFAWTLADAAIRELGLEPQVHYDPDCDHYRYVTDWIADD